MTPLVQDSLATMTTVSASKMSPPLSPKCPQHQPNPSPSSSGSSSKLFRPWRPAESLANAEEERKVAEEKPKVQEESARRRRKKEDREARRSKKRTEEAKATAQNPPSTPVTGQVPTVVPGRNSRIEGGDVHPAPALTTPSILSPSHGYGGHFPQEPGLLPPGLHPFFHPHRPVPPHPFSHLPPHLDPLLLAEMTDAELERLGLLGGYGAIESGMVACGGSPHDPRGLSHPPGKKQRPKKYRCPHCQVAFSNNGQLRGHVRIHTGERPFSCEYEGCGKAFTRNEELTRHRRIHSGQRPFACPLCDKRFGRKDHLKKHARTHAPPPSPHPYLLAAHGAADPRLMLPPPPLSYSAHPGLLLDAGIGASASAEALSSQPAQRIADMAALAGFPYLYGY